MSFLEKAIFISKPHLLRVLEGQVTDVLPAYIGLEDYLFTRVANIWAFMH